MALYNPQKAAWIGLHDLNIENSFEWTSGTYFQDVDSLVHKSNMYQPEVN